MQIKQWSEFGLKKYLWWPGHVCTNLCSVSVHHFSNRLTETINKVLDIVIDCEGSQGRS